MVPLDYYRKLTVTSLITGDSFFIFEAMHLSGLIQTPIYESLHMGPQISSQTFLELEIELCIYTEELYKRVPIAKQHNRKLVGSQCEQMSASN